MNEYSFEVESPLGPSPTAFVLDNVGAEQHEMVLIKLVEDATVEDALAAEMAGPRAVLRRTASRRCSQRGEQTVVNTRSG